MLERIGFVCDKNFKKKDVINLPTFQQSKFGCKIILYLHTIANTLLWVKRLILLHTIYGIVFGWFFFCLAGLFTSIILKVFGFRSRIDKHSSVN